MSYGSLHTSKVIVGFTVKHKLSVTARPANNQVSIKQTVTHNDF